ncbi:MAG: hypothetical protein ACOC3D_11070, partial [Pseudomonadota bacterium]
KGPAERGPDSRGGDGAEAFGAARAAGADDIAYPAPGPGVTPGLAEPILDLLDPVGRATPGHIEDKVKPFVDEHAFWLSGAAGPTPPLDEGHDGGRHRGPSEPAEWTDPTAEIFDDGDAV